MKTPNKINDEIKEYCKINNITDVDAFIIEKISTGFNIEKYGNAPFIQEVIVEKEVPIETIKEIIIEKEVEVQVPVEIIKEIPVEKVVIKEVEIEKEIFITDDKKVLSMGEEINTLKKTIHTKEQMITNIDSKLSEISKKYEIKEKEAKDLLVTKGKLEKKVKENQKKIKDLKGLIVDIEKENTRIKNEKPTSKGRPIRDIYDEEPDTGGYWGSNLKDKK